MQGRAIPLSPFRRIACDYLRFARQIPTVPVQRRMNLAAVSWARQAHSERPSWTAIFTKAFALSAQRFPELRRAYVKLPWPHLYEYPLSVASIAVERELAGERGVFMAKIKDPASLSLAELTHRLRVFQSVPIDECRDFRRALAMSRVPWPVRPLLWWLGLNAGRQRANFFGTFTVSVYSGLGAESLHPLTPSTATLNYGVIDPAGNVDVRIVYDHRVLDGATVARALIELEETLTGPITAELREEAVLHDDSAPELLAGRASDGVRSAVSSPIESI